MVEYRGERKILVTPIKREDIEDINAGDIIWLEGDLMTCRDSVHRRVVFDGMELPYDLRDRVLYHAGPIVRKRDDGSFEMIACGPTTSMRMEKFEYEFVKKTGVRVIIGKGGMKENTERACLDFGAIHCVFPAGCAVTAAEEVLRIKEHHWDELSMSEMIWACEVREFGPLVVSIDSRGRNLFEENRRIINTRKEEAKRRLHPLVAEFMK